LLLCSFGVFVVLSLLVEVEWLVGLLGVGGEIFAHVGGEGYFEQRETRRSVSKSERIEGDKIRVVL
jgi:hypothetical protein